MALARQVRPILARVESGDLPWRGLDDLQTETLHEVARDWGLTIADDDALRLVRAWREIPSWPDAADGLARLRTWFTVCALSNGSVAMLTEMSQTQWFRLGFHRRFDLWRHYKPAREVYCGLAELMEVEPGQVLMVATHRPSTLPADRFAHGVRRTSAGMGRCAQGRFGFTAQ